MTLAASLVLLFALDASPQDKSAPPADDERRIENGLPAHFPLKVKVKNERAFRDPKNREWGRDPEIEVTNTGAKPIYYMHMLVLFEDFVLESGALWATHLRFGRQELQNLGEPVRPEDVPLRPGEAHIFRISEMRWEGFKAVRDEKQKADPKRIRFEMQTIAFGDGTGLESSLGDPAPPAPQESSPQEPASQPLAGSGRPAQAAQT